jgi:AraC-like DNA-binding protein
MRRTRHAKEAEIPIRSSDFGANDPLSGVFTVLNVESFLSRRFEAAGSWALRFPQYSHMKFGCVIEGRRWVWIEGTTAPLLLEPGDFYLISSGTPYLFASDADAEPLDGLSVMKNYLQPDGVVRYGSGQERTVGVGGRFTLDEETSGFLLRSLPPLIHVRGTTPEARSLRSALDLLIYETEAVRPGNGAIGASLCRIVLVNILRAYIESGEKPEGWLGALADRRIGSAVGKMHQDVAHRWTLQKLANEVGMSRTSFAERFRRLVGMAPLEYLTMWRMTIARNALRGDRTNLANIAEKVGYDSETSFSAAFRRMFGKSPGRYRDSQE